jgi:hypothetical protein
MTEQTRKEGKIDMKKIVNVFCEIRQYMIAQTRNEGKIDMKMIVNVFCEIRQYMIAQTKKQSTNEKESVTK